MNELNLITYKDKRGNGNFGDELSYVLLNYLFKHHNKSNIRFTLNGKRKKNNISFIGSVLAGANKGCTTLSVLGSGIRTEKDKINKNTNMKIYAVRGPLTHQYLEKFDYKVNAIYGDPALLLPKFYTPNKIPLCENKIGVVGHLTNFDKYKNLPSEYILINPTWKWENVIDYIYSCKLILSSSLHGLIISDAYNIPNIWLDEYPLDEGHFKFKDYFLSQNRTVENIKKISDYNTIKPYDKGNIIDVTKIETAFLNMCLDFKI
tara:strand:+ start:905 stop:1690 length:786 start_codon:yes stop_codon:yes gene_type:complete